MQHKVFHASCPCCGSRLVIEPRIRRVELVDRTKKPQSTLLDDASELMQDDEKRRTDSFDSALDQERKDKPSLDDFM